MSPPQRLAGALAAVLAVGLGAASLAGWWMGGWRMARLGPDGVPMGPNTSLFFILLGLSFLALLRFPDSREARITAIASSAMVFLASALVAVQLWIPLTLPWDAWLIGSETVVGAMPLGRMSPLATIAFLFTSLAFMAQAAPAPVSRWARLTALAAATLGLVIGLEVLATRASGTPSFYGGRTTPMAVLTALGFVALNVGLLIRTASIQSLADWLQPDRRHENRWFRRGELAAIGLLAALIGFAGLLYMRREQAVARAAVHQQLDAVATLKVAQITAWRNERLGEARFLMRTKAVAQDVAAFIARPSGTQARAQLVDWLEPIRGGTRYESAMVFDASGRLRLSVPATSPAGTVLPAGAFARALAASSVGVADLHRTGGSDEIRLDLLAPIQLPPAREPIALIVLRLDPRDSLFPLTKTWPVPTRTAETLLVRLEGNEVVYLSELRHVANAPLMVRRSMDDPYLPAALGLRGDADIREGLDYRGAAVVATSRAIPGSPWFLVVKIDQAEAYESIRSEAFQTIALGVLLIVVIALALGFFAWQRRSASLARALRAEQERALLSERLALVTKHANDAVILIDEQMRIVDVNDRAESFYGRTPEEMRGLSALDLRAPSARAMADAHFDAARQAEGIVFETVHIRSDGTTFPVEVSSRLVMLQGQRHVFSIVRDITQRKAHEAEIARLNRLYAAHSQVNQAVVHADTREALLNAACKALVQYGGIGMAWVGQLDPAQHAIEPIAHFGDTTGYLRNIRVSTDDIAEGRGPTGTAARENRTFVCNDLLGDSVMTPWHDAAREAGFRASIGLPIRLHGVAAGALTAYAFEVNFFGEREVALLEEAALDIGFGLASLERDALRQTAEAALRESEGRLRLALMAGNQGLYDVNVQTGEASVSPEYPTMLGYDPLTFHHTNATWTERLHPSDRQRVAQIYADYLAGRRTDYRVEFRQRTATGAWKWILSVGRIVERTTTGEPLRMLGTYTDITELKRAEASVAASEVRYRRLFESAKDGILILDAATGMVVDVNPFLLDLLGFSREAFLGKAIWDLGFFKDIVANRDSFAELQKREYIRYEDKPLETADGRRIEVEFVSNLYMVNDVAVIQCNIRDITERHQAEEAMKASLREKEALLKEVHHRVKNNLQVITSLLRLETSRSHEPGTKRVLKDMQGRIRSMALLHETLYRTGNFARVDLASYLSQLAAQSFRGQTADTSAVQLVLDLEPLTVEIDQAIPCGLIANELLSNALKHAFPQGVSGEIRIGLRRGEHGLMRLTVGDTGVGLPADFDEKRQLSLGLQVVSDLAKQLGGSLDIGPGPGATVSGAFTPHPPSTGETGSA